MSRYRARLYSNWDFLMLQNLHIFLAFSCLLILNKAIKLLMTVIMHKHYVYNCELSYNLQLIGTI